MQNWNMTSLARLFAEDPPELGDIDVNLPEGGDVIRLSLKEKGDLDVFVIVSGERDVLASVLLAPCDEVPNREAFERTVLRMHKMVPLSSFGITTVDGKEWYELFGSVSSASSGAVIVEEVAVLADNAVEAAQFIAEWKRGEVAA